MTPSTSPRGSRQVRQSGARVEIIRRGVTSAGDEFISVILSMPL